MLASHPGSFFCYVPKTPSFFSGLLGAKSTVEQAVNERLDSNLKELRARRREYAVSGTAVPDGAGTGALTTACLLELYSHFDNGRELMMLSELQGQYAFVLYDSNKKQVFAARDPSGAEHLYYRIDDDGGISWTNTLDELPSSEQNISLWKELKPGHYMLGKTVAQFALSLRQLEKRERKESLDADALHAMLQRESQLTEEEERGGFGAVRALLRNRSK